MTRTPGFYFRACFKIALSPAAFFWLALAGAADDDKTAAELKSPDANIAVTFALHDDGGRKACPVYSVSYRGKPILAESRLGLALKDGTPLDSGFKIIKLAGTSHDEKWKPVYGERSSYRDHYNQLVVE